MSLERHPCFFEERPVKMIKISVVMGVYNEKNQDQFKEAVQSILTQDIDGIELLLCDDGSDEEATIILRDIAKMDSRIRILRQEHRGLGAALNMGINHAEGKYIARMDADDISTGGRLRKQYKFLEENLQYDWVGCCAAVFDGSGVWGHRKMPQIPRNTDFYKCSPYIHPGVMFRKEVFEQCGCYMVSGITARCEDYELFMRFHSMNRQGYNLQEELLYYREGKDAYRKRKYRYRIRERIIRYKGFKMLQINQDKGKYYIFKPLFVGLCPGMLTRFLRERCGNAAGGYDG